MTTPMPESKSVEALDSQGQIAVDAVCIGCRYNLRGLDPVRGMCPECGRAIADSFDLRQLRFAPPAQLRDLARLSSRVFVAFLVTPVLGILGAFFEWPTNHVLLAIAIVLPIVPIWFFLPRSADGAMCPLHDERDIAGALRDMFWWRRGVLVALGVLFAQLIFASASLMPDYSETLSWFLIIALAYTALIAWASMLHLCSALTHRIPALSTARLLARTANGVSVFAPCFCGAAAIALASHTVVRSDCFGFVAFIFAIACFFFAGPVVMFCSLLSLVLFRRRLAELEAK